MDFTSEKSRWQPIMGIEENGLMQECCDITQPTQDSFNVDSMK